MRLKGIPGPHVGVAVADFAAYADSIAIVDMFVAAGQMRNPEQAGSAI